MRNDKKEAASEETASFFYYGSPNGIRTRVLTLRGLRPRPLVDGAISCWLGNLDSNQDYLIQSQASCHWTIPQLRFFFRSMWCGEYITTNRAFDKGQARFSFDEIKSENLVFQCFLRRFCFLLPPPDNLIRSCFVYRQNMFPKRSRLP